MDILYKLMSPTRKPCTPHDGHERQFSYGFSIHIQRGLDIKCLYKARSTTDRRSACLIDVESPSRQCGRIQQDPAASTYRESTV